MSEVSTETNDTKKEETPVTEEAPKSPTKVADPTSAESTTSTTDLGKKEEIISDLEATAMTDEFEYLINGATNPAGSSNGRVSFLSSEEEEEEAAMQAPIVYQSMQPSSSTMDEEDLYLVKTTLKSDYDEESLKFEHEYFPKDIIHNFAITLWRMPIKTIKHIASKNNVTISDPKLKKGKRLTEDHKKEFLIFEIGKKVVSVGVKHFLTELDREDMRFALKDLISNETAMDIVENAKQQKDIDEEHLLSAKNIHLFKKSDLRFNFKLIFEKMGAEELLDALTDATLILFLQALEINEVDTTHSNLVDAILEEVFLYGAKEVLAKCKKSILREAAEAAQYEQKKQVFDASPTKEMLSEVILVDEFPHVAEDLMSRLKKKKPHLFDDSSNIKPKKRSYTEAAASVVASSLTEDDEFDDHSDIDGVNSPNSKNHKKRGRKRVINTEGERPQIDRGITYNDLKDKYLVQELISFAQSKGIKYVGVKKTDLCNSIIKYLNGELVPSLKKRGRGRPPKKRKENPEDGDDHDDDDTMEEGHEVADSMEGEE
ncbi:hypothetical protein NAEGRDRAFT_81259 [Naegleria gruberi]|uniref:Uncharacterized protein n=1 Tax=Naegleria gruberi TaxID=5762 RepID=D2VUE1_NAEGR|nr:uncharacterized protein NAEGRDRAFT_81259 [Naegleria gruberi]EFC39609.1 hypothetical protein NAEGRDRAFT_81259 [Naegleria gruberi]|eukprot:XP_002672353.1 hypothetical protein NAEGRDRAFT_81259 [Naegleria gruberi strain NEG-M]